MWISCCLLLSGLIVSVHSNYIETINVELLVENGAEINTRFRREDGRMPESLVFRLTRNSETAILQLTKIPPLPTSAVRADGQHFLDHSSQDIATYVDYITKAVILIRRKPDTENYYNLEGHLQIGMRLVHIKPNDDWSQHVITRQETLRYKPQENPGHRQKRSLKVFTVEVGFIADYQNFYSFFGRNNNDTTLAEVEMRNYYAFIAEKLKVRFHHVNEVDGFIAIDVVTSGLTIVEDRKFATFSEDYVKDNTLEAETMLNASQYWALSPPNGIQLAPSDHYMFFTGYNLIHAENLGNAGLAYKGAVCQEKLFSNLVTSASIVEDHRDGETGVTASHELGHALDMSHDGDVGCKNSDSYIMSGSAVVIQDPALAQRPWQFSTCSVRELKAYVLGPGGVCLGDNRYGTGVVSSAERPGQYFSLDEQCAMKYGEGRTLCTFPYLTDKDKLCYLLWCFDGESSCDSARVMEYSPCDTNRWCHRGLCVKANNTIPEFVNLPTESVKLSPTAQGVILKVLTFDPDIRDVMTFHITWDPPSMANILDFNTDKKEVQIKTGQTLASTKNFSVIMSVDDGLLVTLPVNVDFEVSQQTNSPPWFTQSTYRDIASEGKAGAFVYDLSKKVTDTDSSVYTFSIRPGPFSTYFNINNTGIITYAVDYDYDPIGLPNSITLVVQVTDDTQLTATATVVLTIQNVDQPSQFQNLPNTVNVPEDTQPGHVIFVVGANDADSADVLKYDFLNPSSFTVLYLRINPNTGEITLADDKQIDFEAVAQKTYSIPVSVSTNFGSVTSTLTINLVNVNEKPSFRDNSYDIEVTNGPKGTIVVQSLTGFVSDPDVGDTVTYRIETGDFSYYFNINTTNGQVTFAENYGYDRTIYPREVSLTVTATDAGGLTDTVVLKITIVTLNQNPVITNLPAAAVVVENSAAGFVVFTVFFTDVNPGDTHTFSLSSTQAGIADAFTIDNNGTIKVNTGETLDYETSPQKIYLQVTVTDQEGAVSDPKTLTVTLTDVNEAPKFNQTEYNFTVSEGKAGQVLINSLLPFVVDPDAGDTFQFSLVPSPYSLHFMVDRNNGSITFKDDYDADPKRLPNRVDMYVIVRDANLLFHEADFIFTITNVNQAPRFSNLPQTIELESLIADEFVVFTVNAIDVDSEDVLTLEVDLQQAPYFTFDKTAKTVSIINSVGITDNTTFIIPFTVSDGRLSHTENLTIKYTILPLVTTSTSTTVQPTTTAHQLFILDLPADVSIAENFGSGSFYIVKTNTLDASKLSFTFQQFPVGLPELFVINNGGKVSVKEGVTLDFESLPSTIYLLITAYEGSLQSSPEYLNISITDVNERVSFNQSVYSFSFNNAQAGQLLISSMLPFLVDPDTTDTYTFALLNGTDSNHFQINSSTGSLSLVETFNINNISADVQLTITVKDAASPFLTTQVRMTFNKPPVFTNLPTTIDVPEVTSQSVEVFTVSVTDPNKGDVVVVFEDRHTFDGFANLNIVFDAANGNTVSVQGTALPNAPVKRATVYFFATDGTYQIQSSLVINFVKTVQSTMKPNTTTSVTTKDTADKTTDSADQTGRTDNPSSVSSTTSIITSTDDEPLFHRPWVIAVLAVIGILIPTLILLVVCVIYRRSKQGDNSSQSSETDIYTSSQRSRVIRPRNHPEYFTNPDFIYEKDVEY